MAGEGWGEGWQGEGYATGYARSLQRERARVRVFRGCGVVAERGRSGADYGSVRRRGALSC